MTNRENSNVFLTSSGLPCFTIDSSVDLPTDIRTCISYYTPRLFASPGNITSSIEPFREPIRRTHSIIYKEGYIYWSTYDGVKRMSIYGGDIKTIFAPYYDGHVDYTIYDYGFTIINDGSSIPKIIQLQWAEYGDGDFTSDWQIELHMGNFNNNETKIIASIQEYLDEGEWDEVYVYFTVVTPQNKRAVISGYKFDWSEETFVFFVRVYDIETGTELLFYELEPINEMYFFQYPICPPVTIGNKVYIEFHFGCDEESWDGTWNDNLTPVVFEVNTDTLQVRVARPTLFVDGYERYIATLYQCVYEDSSNSLIFLYERYNWHEYLGGDAHYGIMSMSLTDFSTNILWEVRYNDETHENADDSPLCLLVGPNNTNYMVKRENYQVYNVNDLNTVITTLPLDNPPYPHHVMRNAEFAQPNNICNIIDENGYIWITSGCTLKAYSVFGQNTINTGIRVPFNIPYSQFPASQTIYLINGKMFISNINIADSDFNPDIQMMV